MPTYAFKETCTPTTIDAVMQTLPLRLIAPLTMALIVGHCYLKIYILFKIQNINHRGQLKHLADTDQSRIIGMMRLEVLVGRYLSYVGS